MAINILYNGATIFKPGSYSKTKVNLTGGFQFSPAGIVAIVGESEGGEPGSSAGILRFTSEDVASLVDIYKSGPIVDAARILVAPARDARVANGASQILVFKTNASTKSSRTFKNAAPVNLLTFSSANYGEDENQVSVKIEAGSSANSRVITVKKSTKTEVLAENADADMLQIQYSGTEASADVTIQSGSLVISAGVDSLSISLANKSIEDIVELVDAEDFFSASSTLLSAASKAASDLDPISTAVDCKASALVFKAAQKELIDIVNNTSELVTVVRASDVEGQVAALGRRFLKNGAKGASTNAAFQAAFDALLAERANIVIPLISRDASDMISEAKTDSASTFTIDAVNLQTVTHCITASNTKNRSERNCYVSKKDTFANSQTAAQTLGHERATMLFQDAEVLGADGSLKVEEPWASACIVGGIQAGTDIGTPATFKRINVNGIAHSDYNSKTQVDLAIQAGLCPLEELDSGGFRVVVHNTTYGADSNFVYNRASVVEAADFVAYNLRKQLEDTFVGNKAATGTAVSIKNAVVSIMSSFLVADVTVGDDTNGGLGYKDLIVSVVNNSASIKITITPVQGVDFVLSDITLDSIRQSA